MSNKLRDISLIPKYSYMAVTENTRIDTPVYLFAGNQRKILNGSVQQAF